MTLLGIKLITRASRNEIVGYQADGRLKIKVQAAPVDGAANKALILLLSKEYSIPKSAFRIVRGATIPEKTIEISAPHFAVGHS